MRIGIDIDEVVAEFVEGYLELFNKKFEKEAKKEDILTYDLWKNLGISKEDSFNLAHEFFKSPIFERVKLIEGAVESIPKLSENNELFFITSRPIDFKSKTENFLTKNFSNINFKLIHSGDRFKNGLKSKSEICEDEGVEIIIEDQPDYCFDCAKKGIRAFLFDKPWNKNFDESKSENIIRIKNWNEILEKINDLKLKIKNEL